jgi:hypothetical protein
MVDRPDALSFRLSSLHEVLDDTEVATPFELARRSTTWAAHGRTAR